MIDPVLVRVAGDRGGPALFLEGLVVGRQSVGIDDSVHVGEMLQEVHAFQRGADGAEEACAGGKLEGVSGGREEEGVQEGDAEGKIWVVVKCGM